MRGGRRTEEIEKKKSIQFFTFVVEQPAPKAAVALGPGAAAVVHGVQRRHTLGERLANFDGGRWCCIFSSSFGVIAPPRLLFRWCRRRRCGCGLKKRRRHGFPCSSRCWRRSRVAKTLSWRRCHAERNRKEARKALSFFLSSSWCACFFFSWPVKGEKVEGELVGSLSLALLALLSLSPPLSLRSLHFRRRCFCLFEWRTEKIPPGGGEQGLLPTRQSLPRDGRLTTPPLGKLRAVAPPARAPVRPCGKKEAPPIRRRRPMLLLLRRRSSSLLLLLRNSRSPLPSLRPSSARQCTLRCLLLPRRTRSGAGVAAEAAAAAATGAR